MSDVSFEALKAANPQMYADASVRTGAGTGSYETDLLAHMREAAEEVRKQQLDHKTDTVAIVVDPDTYEAIGAVALKAVGDLLPEQVRRVAAFGIVMQAKKGGFGASWGGAPVFIDKRVEHVNVGVIKKVNADGRTSDGSYVK